MTPPGATTPQASPTTLTPPPAQTTGSTTYIPVPIPAIRKEVSVGGAIFGVTSLIVLSILARFLWRLPERQMHKQWVQDLGGASSVQNRALHGIGYLALVAGFLTNAYVLGIIAAALMMIAANTRPQGDQA